MLQLPVVPARKRSSKLIVSVVVAIVGLLLLGGGSYWDYLQYQTKAEGEPAVVRITRKVPPPSATQSRTSAGPSQLPKPRVSGTMCGQSGKFDAYAATYVTSCPFAVSVAKAADGIDFDRQQRVGVQAYSPTTGRNYAMSCWRQPDSSITCTGGDNAVVNLVAR